MNIKNCTKCGKTYPATIKYFRKDKRGKNGLGAQCKSCANDYNRKYGQTKQGKQAINKAGKKYRKTPMGCLRHCFQAIKQRCNNPKDQNYKDYGGRGIKCLFNSSNDFIHYVLGKLQINSPHGFDIDRIDNDGNYEPGNIRFVTHKENMNNRHRRRD